jgi:hypothetical protein
VKAVTFRQARHPIATPPRDVGDEDVLPEVQLGLEENPPARHGVGPAWRAVERPEQ